MSFGEELIHSAKDALAIARGEIEPAGVFVPETVDVAGLGAESPLPGSCRPGVDGAD